MNEQEPQRKTKDQLKVIALKQRIGEITSNYEETLADMRADITQSMESMQSEMSRLLNDIESKNNEIDSLNKRIDEIQKEKAGTKSSK